jgi:hypothetical protein
MNVWLSRQAVGRIAELLAVVAGASHTSEQQRRELYDRCSQVRELMPVSEVLELAAILDQAAGQPGLSAAARADCWSWSSYLERLMVGGPTETTGADQPGAQARPARNAVLVPGLGAAAVVSPEPRGTAVVMW